MDDGQTFNSLGPCPREAGNHGNGPDPLTEVTLTPGTRTGNMATLEYSLPAASDVLIAVYDIAGRRVVTLEHTAQSAGTHEVSWKTSGVARGMYFYRLRTGRVTLSRSVLILK